MNPRTERYGREIAYILALYVVGFIILVAILYRPGTSQQAAEIKQLKRDLKACQQLTRAVRARAADCFENAVNLPLPTGKPSELYARYGGKGETR